MRQLEHLLADDFADEEPLGLIGDVVGRVNRTAFGQILKEQLLEHIDVGAVGGRDRHELHERVRLPVVVEDRQQLRLGNQVHLVQRENRRRLHVLDQAEQVAIAGPRLDRDVDDQRQQIDLLVEETAILGAEIRDLRSKDPRASADGLPSP